MQTVYVNGSYKGEIERKHGRLWWHRAHAGVDSFPKGSTVDDIRKHIARLCAVDISAVTTKGVKP